MWNDLVFFWPVPDAIYTVNIHHYLLHASDADTISLPDRTKWAVYEGVLSEVLKKNQQYEAAGIHNQSYHRELHTLMQNTRMQPRFTRYRSI